MPDGWAELCCRQHSMVGMVRQAALRDERWRGRCFWAGFHTSSHGFPGHGSPRGPTLTRIGETISHYPLLVMGGFPKKARLQDEIGVTANLEACGEGHEVMVYIVVHKTTGDRCLFIAMAHVTEPCAVAYELA